MQVLFGTSLYASRPALHPPGELVYQQAKLRHTKYKTIGYLFELSPPLDQKLMQDLWSDSHIDLL